MKREKQLEAILVICCGFLVMFLVFKAKWLVLLALGIGIGSLASAKVMRLIVAGWFKLAELLGYINSRILLSLLFFGLLTPLAFFYRLFHKNLLQLNKNPTGTYFKKRNHTFRPQDFEKPW